MKKHILLFLFFIFSINRMSAQESWGGGVDGEQLHFGFTFQFVATEFKILKLAEWNDQFNGLRMINSEMRSLTSPVIAGFGLGFVSDYRLGDNANLRFTPAMVFADRIVNYEFNDPTFNTQRKIQATLADLPVGIKLKSDRRRNFRAYMIAGMRYSIDVTSKNKSDDIALSPEAKFLKNNKNTLWYEAGVGFDLYFEWLKMSPEIKFAQSTRSVLRDEDRLENPYTAPIDKLFIRNLQFSLYFE
jgi:hypothetical protein